MLILTIRTDKPEAEIGLYEDQTQLAYDTWQAHRQLAETINHKLIAVLQSKGHLLHELQAVVCFKGPGSFTGLRIGLSVGNALAYALHIPIVSNEGKDWLEAGIQRLLDNQNERIAMPEYGALPNITAPKH